MRYAPLLLLLFGATPAARADGVLNGALRVDLPDGMSMRAAPLSEHERAVLVDRGRHFILDVWDTLALPGPDLEKSVRADLATQGVPPDSAIEKLALPPPLIGIAVVPPPPPTKDVETRLVYAAYVSAPSTTVQAFAFYAKPGSSDPQWLDRARRIAASIAPQRPPFIWRSSLILTGSVSAAKTVALPEPWRVVMRPEGERLIKPLPLGAPPMSCDIEPGRLAAPSAATGATSVDGKLRGQAVAWHVWRTGSFVTDGRVSVTCRAARPAQLAELRDAVEQLAR